MTAMDRAALLRRLEELPPDFFKTLTPDQRRHFRFCKQVMIMLREEFQRYFSGGQSYSATMADKKNQSYLRSQRNRWLWFYNLLFDHYDLLEVKAAEDGVKIPDTPGEYLIACLEDYSINLFWEASFGATAAEATFSPSASYKAHQESNRLRPLFEKDSEALSPSERVKMSRFIEKYAPQVLHPGLPVLRSFAEDVFISHLKKDKNVKKLWRQYRIACDEVEVESARVVHPQGGLPGYRWEAGGKIQM
jgi:hypothetical protein